MVKHELVVDAGQALFAEEQSQQRPGARNLYTRLGQYLGDGRDGKAGIGEGPFDSRPRQLFILAERHLVAAGSHGFSFHRQLFGFGKKRVKQERRSTQEFARPKFLARDTGL